MSIATKTIDPADVMEAIDKLSTWTQSPDVAKVPQQELKRVFASLSGYLTELVRDAQFQRESVREAVNGLIELAFEAVERCEAMQGKGSVIDLPEFQKLKALYEHKILPLFPKSREVDTVAAPALAERSGVLEGLQEVKKDLDYELFLIKKEDGSSYVTPFIRDHFGLLSKINQLFVEDEGLFRKIEVARDRIYHELAKTILKEKVALIDAFYKEAFKFKNHEFIQCVNKALMALMLCGNPRHLRVNTTSKSSEGYYRDFHLYVRAASAIPQNRRGGAERSEHFLHIAAQMHAELCQALFVTPLHQEPMRAVLLEERKKIEGKGHSLDFYKELQREDHALRQQLQTMASGPLLKGLEMLEEKMVGFDPVLQPAPLGQLYRFVSGPLDVSLLTLPSPTSQESISQALIVQEFSDWILDLGCKGRHHLLINLQDRTSWKERARACALELHSCPGALTVISIDCKTLFYEQRGSYLEWDDAQEFIKQCQDQLFSQSTGYWLPRHLNLEETKGFVATALSAIHELFFDKKARLTQQNRRHFIDIFHLLFAIKVAEMQKVDTLSFTDKDGSDEAAVMNASLFALLAMMKTGPSLSLEEREEVMALVYERALWNRGRLVQEDVMERMIGTLHTVGAAFELHRGKVTQTLSSLFAFPLVLEN